MYWVCYQLFGICLREFMTHENVAVFPGPLDWPPLGCITHIFDRRFDIPTKKRSDNDFPWGESIIGGDAARYLSTNQACAAQDEETLFLGHHCTSQCVCHNWHIIG